MRRGDGSCICRGPEGGRDGVARVVVEKLGLPSAARARAKRQVRCLVTDGDLSSRAGALARPRHERAFQLHNSTPAPPGCPELCQDEPNIASRTTLPRDLHAPQPNSVVSSPAIALRVGFLARSSCMPNAFVVQYDPSPATDRDNREPLISIPITAACPDLTDTPSVFSSHLWTAMASPFTPQEHHGMPLVSANSAGDGNADPAESIPRRIMRGEYQAPGHDEAI